LSPRRAGNSIVRVHPQGRRNVSAIAVGQRRWKLF